MLSVALVTLGDPSTLTGGYLYHQRVAELAGANDARVEFLSFPNWPFPSPLLHCGRISTAVRGYDVVLLDSIAAAYTAPRPLALRAPVAAMLHQPPGGIDHGPFRRRVQARLDLRGYTGVSRFLAASQSIADDLLSRGIPSTAVRVVPPGTQPPAALTAQHEDLRAGRTMALLSVGNWLPRKGLADLLAAVASLPQHAVTLHLVGDTDVDPAYRRRIQRRLRQPDLSDRVVVHGPVTRQRIASLYASADAFALPSYVEPYGTAYAEAMAAGLPVLGWRTGNLPNLARHNLEGLIFSPGDIASLAAALHNLSSNPTERQRLARGVRDRARSLPSWEQTATTLFAELRALAATPGAQGQRRPPNSQS